MRIFSLWTWTAKNESVCALSVLYSTVQCSFRSPLAPVPSGLLSGSAPTPFSCCFCHCRFLHLRIESPSLTDLVVCSAASSGLVLLVPAAQFLAPPTIPAAPFNHRHAVLLYCPHPYTILSTVLHTYSKCDTGHSS